jgi:hypothetical protein
MSSEPEQPPLEMLAEWQGKAIHHPGVLFGDSDAEHLSTHEDAAAIADWIAVTAISGANGSPAHDAVRRKVVTFLKDWRGRFGQPKLDEIKVRLLAEMQKYRTNRKITDQELHKRIESLFEEVGR